MTRIILTIVFLLLFSNSLYAGVDQEFGKKTSWWTPHYNKLLGYLGLEKSYALVIGVGKYDDPTFSHLPSEKDAVRIKDYLINEAGFDHVRLIMGDQVDLDKIRYLMIDHYPKQLTDKDRFLFYWSGHGVTTGHGGRKLGYLTLKNSSNNSFSTMLSMRDLSEWDNRFRAKQTLYLLDACFSGMAASKAMSITQEQSIERVNRPSRQVLTAGLENQQTIAVSDLDGGVFTRALLDGLRGHADTDKGPYQKDGVVTARELEEYVRERVDHERRRVRWPNQITPVLYNFSRYEGDFFFVWDKRIVKSEMLIKDDRPVAKGVIATGVEVPASSTEPKPQPVPQAEPPINRRRAFEPELVSIPAGSFTMGCVSFRDDLVFDCWVSPVTVQVSAFKLSKYEITVGQYMACVEEKVCPQPEWQEKGSEYNIHTGTDDYLYKSYKRMGSALTASNHPIVGVSWQNAKTYAQWLSQQTGKPWRLPSEAEWEYAARGGDNDQAFPWGQVASHQHMNYRGRSGKDQWEYTAPVGSFAANGFGLHDMHGNVREWVEDCWHGSHLGRPTTGIAWQDQCNSASPRVVRGGSWNDRVRSVSSARSRLWGDTVSRDVSAGFRLARGH